MFWSALPKICAMPFDPPPFRQSISTSSTTRPAAALSMRMPCVAEPVILERRIVTFAALTTIWPPWTCRFWMTVPGVLTTRFPVWGVRTVPAGTPVLVGPGHVAVIAALIVRVDELVSRARVVSRATDSRPRRWGRGPKRRPVSFAGARCEGHDRRDDEVPHA